LGRVQKKKKWSATFVEKKKRWAAPRGVKRGAGGGVGGGKTKKKKKISMSGRRCSLRKGRTKQKRKNGCVTSRMHVETANC